MTKPREPSHTLAFVDDYCAHYRSVFRNVRHFEQFIQLELRLLAETKRKSLPRLAKTAKADRQALHHFLANAEWFVNELCAIRFRLTRDMLVFSMAKQPMKIRNDELGCTGFANSRRYVAYS